MSTKYCRNFRPDHNHNPKTLPRIEKPVQESKSVLDSGKYFAFLDVFLDCNKYFLILGSILDPWNCFWILGRVFGLWEVFWILGYVFMLWDMFWILASIFEFKKVLWILGCVLDLGTCFVPRTATVNLSNFRRTILGEQKYLNFPK